MMKGEERTVFEFFSFHIFSFSIPLPSLFSLFLTFSLTLSLSQAVKNVNEVIAPAIIGRDPVDQVAIDKLMLELDGTGVCEGEREREKRETEAIERGGRRGRWG